MVTLDIFIFLKLVVPASVSDEDLKQVASHRSRNRLPVSIPHFLLSVILNVLWKKLNTQLI